MPTYEYECTKCGYVFEEFQSITADPLSECPKCGHAIRRLISAGLGIIFKGSGFYTTDNKKGSPVKSSGSESKSTSESKPSSDSKATTAEKGKTSEKSGTSSD